MPLFSNTQQAVSQTKETNKGDKKMVGKANRSTRRRLRKTDVLVIDEISMVSNHFLERVNMTLKAIRCGPMFEEGTAPAFGGVQLVVSGDFCQLPPVKPFEGRYCLKCGHEVFTDEDGDESNCMDDHCAPRHNMRWAFESFAWEEANFAHVHLNEIHRQNDQSFIRMLQKYRLGNPLSADERRTLLNHPCNVEGATRLLCTRSEVEEINNQEFDELNTRRFEYQSLDTISADDKNTGLTDAHLNTLKNNRLETQVRLRTGMLVVLQINLDFSLGLCNGSQGVICDWDEFNPAQLPKAERSLPVWQDLKGEHAKHREDQIQRFMKAQEKKNVTRWPRVRFHNGQERTIFPMCIVIPLFTSVVTPDGTKSQNPLLSRTQIPLMAGWALTVHRSQGMTLDRVIVNLSKAFEEGQAYVALSRATSLGGPEVQGLEDASDDFSMDKDVKSFLQEKFGNDLWSDHAAAQPRTNPARLISVLRWQPLNRPPASHPSEEFADSIPWDDLPGMTSLEDRPASVSSDQFADLSPLDGFSDIVATA